MTTAGKIIRQALDGLGLRGAGQKVDGTVEKDILDKLNVMLDGMNLGPTFAYTDLETVYALPAATISVTIGPGMQINIPRPVRIEDSSYVLVSGNSYPLEVIDRAEYNLIMQKDQGGSWPSRVFFDGGNPTGKLYFWQTGACEIHLITRAAVASFADATTDYVLPTGLERMLWSSLSEEIAPDFQVTVPDATAKIAASARRMFRRSNLAVPQMAIPDICSGGQNLLEGNILGGWR